MANEYKLSYTAKEIDTKLGKIDNLATKSEVPTKTSDLTNDSGYITDYTETDPTVPSWAKSSTKPSYTKSEVGLGNVDNVKQYSTSNPPPYPVTKVNNKTGAVALSASDVGADATGTASSAVSAHNTNSSAHTDIREQISQLSSEIADLNIPSITQEAGQSESLVMSQKAVTNLIAETQGGGGGASVQSDWNQTDETAADFIKNKPFYDNRVETVIIEEAEYVPDSSGMVFYSEELVSILSDTIYNVYWDDSAIYQLLPTMQEGVMILGDINFETYPFAIFAIGGFGTAGGFNDTLPHKVKVTAKIGNVQKIDASLISSEWSAMSLKMEDIIIPLASRNFSNGGLTIPNEKIFSLCSDLTDDLADSYLLKIIWNGVEYSNQSFSISTVLEDDGSVGGYIFFLNDIQFTIGRECIWIYAENCETATFSISIVNKVPLKMPMEYLPNEFILVSPGGKSFVIAVDDSGTLTTTEVIA